MSTETADGMKIADTTANPAPLGLLGFGMTTVLLNIHNTGLYPVNSMIMAMGLFVGGLAQVIAGVQEWKKNNTFGATAFTAYGFFWIALVATWLLPKFGYLGVADESMPVNMALAAASGETAMGFFLTLWGIFTLGMFFGTLRLNKALQVVFGSLTILFFGLATRDFLLSAGVEVGKTVGIISGWIGIFCGFSAMYACLAQILNEVYGRVVLPIGPVKRA